MAMLRDSLLTGRGVAVAGSVSETVLQRLAALGARIETLPPLAGEEEADEPARNGAPVDALVYDAAGSFGAGGEIGLTRALDAAWAAVTAVATGELIPRGRQGKLVLTAPRPRAGSHAEAARAGLENLARTLSVEWARYGITTAAIAPGDSTSEDELAELICFLVSPAGEYFSGCRFDLAVVPPAQ
jgi:NAD(P)-dependent dehydrogenase (short-subunit alcohol dehydrogenase family)